MLSKCDVSAVDKATAAWGMEIPDWVLVLAQECDLSSQNKVADRIGYSPAAVSQLLKNAYKANVQAIKQAVNGAFMGKLIECPMLGDLPANECLKNQRLSFAVTNPMRVRLYRACRNCRHNISDKKV